MLHLHFICFLIFSIQFDSQTIIILIHDCCIFFLNFLIISYVTFPCLMERRILTTDKFGNKSIFTIYYTRITVIDNKTISNLTTLQFSIDTISLIFVFFKLLFVFVCVGLQIFDIAYSNLKYAFHECRVTLQMCWVTQVHAVLHAHQT